jgi:phosphoribosylformylglycinamidine cyclo-ligase
VKKQFTYAETGVDREVRAESKKALSLLKQTYKFSRYGKVLTLPYGNIFPFGKDLFLDLQVEGVGTKVLVAELAQKYDTIGIDAVALAVNDLIRSGAKPIALADNIHAQISDPKLVREWLKGIVKGAVESECIVPSGEIGDVPEVVKGLTEGKGFDMVVATIGEVHRNKVILGNHIKAGDAVIGLRSSGIHSNGISLARKVLFKQWGGKYEAFDVPEGFDREIISEILEPMEIYVKPFLRLAEKFEIKGAVHITGDAYLKFDRLMAFNKGIGFEFSYFKPQPIFKLIQETARQIKGVISDEEMFKTFNMGWGFAIVVDEKIKNQATDLLQGKGVETAQIGKVTGLGKIVVKHGGKKMVLSRQLNTFRKI